MIIYNCSDRASHPIYRQLPQILQTGDLLGPFIPSRIAIQLDFSDRSQSSWR